MEKNQLLAELYSLRAGLSAIEVERKPLIAGENEVKRLDNKISSNEGKIRSKKGDITYANSQIDGYNVKNKTNARNTRYDFLDALLPSGLFAILGAGLGFVVCIIVGAIVHNINKRVDSYFEDYILYYVLVFAAASAVIYFIGSMIPMIKLTRGEKSNNNKNIRDCYRTIENSKDDIEALIEENKGVRAKRRKAAEKYNKDAEVIVPTIKILYNALVDTYGGLLDPRDWENLDLIVYYITTGRADTLKEALQQVDTQKRADTLVQAIGEASNAICQTINVSINALREDMKACFSSLKSQLASQHAQQMSALSSISSNVEKVESRLKSINTNTAMQTALLSEINVSSKKLAESASSISLYGVKAL